MSTNSALSRLLSWSPALLGMAAIFWASSLPGDAIHLPGFRFSDKAAHFAAYGVLGFLIGLRHALLRRLAGGNLDFALGQAGGIASASASSPVRVPADRVGAVTGILYGLSDEIHQMFVPMREAAISDFAADALGVLAGLYVIRRLARLLPGPAQTP